MKNSRDVLGLPVIELTEGRSLGRVQGLIFNPVSRKVESLEVGERSLLKTKTVLVPFNRIRSIGNDAITLHEDVYTESESAENGGYKLLGGRLITMDGSLVGTVDDYTFSLEDGTATELLVLVERSRSLLKLPISAVANFGRDFIILNDNYREMSSEITPPDSTTKQFINTVETKAVQFALGREAGQDVFDDEGQPVIRKGETVTADIIDLARAKNRLSNVLLAAGVGELLEGLDFTKEKVDAGSKKLLDAWQRLRHRSHEWVSRRLDDEKISPTGELRELWYQLQNKVNQSGRELEEATRVKIKQYVTGKMLNQSVYGKQGEVFAAKGDTVTPELAEKAEAEGLLPQLLLVSVASDAQSALEPIIQHVQNFIRDLDRRK